MGEEKIEDNVAVNTVTPPSVENQLEVSDIPSTANDSVSQKREREEKNDEDSSNKKLKVNETVKLCEENSNDETDATAEEQKLTSTQNEDNSEPDATHTVSKTTDEEKEVKPKETSADLTVSEPTETVSSTTTFKGGFGSFVNSGFGSATDSSSPNIFSSASNSTTSAQTNGTATTSAFSSAASIFKGGFSGFGSSNTLASEKKDNPWTESKVLPKVSISLQE